MNPVSGSLWAVHPEGSATSAGIRTAGRCELRSRCRQVSSGEICTLQPASSTISVYLNLCHALLPLNRPPGIPKPVSHGSVDLTSATNFSTLQTPSFSSPVHGMPSTHSARIATKDVGTQLSGSMRPLRVPSSFPISFFSCATAAANNILENRAPNAGKLAGKGGNRAGHAERQQEA